MRSPLMSPKLKPIRSLATCLRREDTSRLPYSPERLQDCSHGVVMNLTILSG